MTHLRRGFSLIEIAIAVVLLGIIAGIGGYLLVGQLDKANKESASISAHRFEELYRALLIPANEATMTQAQHSALVATAISELSYDEVLTHIENSPVINDDEVTWTTEGGVNVRVVLSANQNVRSAIYITP